MIERNTYPDIRRRQIPGSDPVPSASYNGQFKVTKTGDLSYSVTWGSREGYSEAGYIVAGADSETVSNGSGSVLGTSQYSFVYAVVNYSGATWGATISSSNVYPSQAEASEYFVLATIEVDLGTNTITEISQDHTGPLHVTRIA